MRHRCVRVVRTAANAIPPYPPAVERAHERASLDRDKHAIRDAHVGFDPPNMMRLGPWGKTPGVSRRERAQSGEVHPAIAAIVGAKHRTWFGAGIDDAEPVSLFRVTHSNRGDHQVVDAPSDWFPIPAAVAASEETGTRSSAVHLGRAAQVDRNTSGRQSGQVFVDRPGGGAPSDQHGRSGYDYDADHDSISSITPLGHTKHDLAVFLSSWRSRLTGRHPMNPWQFLGDVLPGLGCILECVHGRNVWSYCPLFQQSPDSAEHVP